MAVGSIRAGCRVAKTVAVRVNRMTMAGSRVRMGRFSRRAPTDCATRVGMTSPSMGMVDCSTSARECAACAACRRANLELPTDVWDVERERAITSAVEDANDIEQPLVVNPIDLPPIT